MRTIGSGLLAHLALPTATLATLVKVTRRDGQVFGFTDHDRPLTYLGTAYAALAGVAPSQVASGSDFAVDDLEIAGGLAALGVTAADIEAGLWDAARVDAWLVNWADLSQGHVVQRRADLGQVRRSGGGFVAECRGLLHRLGANMLRTVLPTCDAQLGDARCGLSLAALTHAATVTTVTSRTQLTAAALTQAADYFAHGLVTFTSGANAGYSMEIKSHPGSGALTLFLPLPFALTVGDAFDAVAGCAKTLAACQGFGNVVNFRGFPYLPGVDRMVSNGAQP